jgi:hypothetical protein
MTTIVARPRPLATSTPRTAPSLPAAEKRSARRRQLVHRGVVASYLHDISARHTPAAAAAYRSLNLSNDLTTSHSWPG